MTQKEAELVVTQGLALGIRVQVNHLDINRMSVTINNVTVCNSYKVAIARITTVFLKNSK